MKKSDDDDLGCHILLFNWYLICQRIQWGRTTKVHDFITMTFLFQFIVWRKYRDLDSVIMMREGKKKLVDNHLDRKDIRESSRSLKHYTIGKVKDMTLMILETLFKEKQIFSVFFQISSAVYVWTQERYSFQMKRSHFDKMTSITHFRFEGENILQLSGKRFEETNAS